MHECMKQRDANYGGAEAKARCKKAANVVKTLISYKTAFVGIYTCCSYNICASTRPQATVQLPSVQRASKH